MVFLSFLIWIDLRNFLKKLILSVRIPSIKAIENLSKPTISMESLKSDIVDLNNRFDKLETLLLEIKKNQEVQMKQEK